MDVMQMPYISFICILYHLRDLETETYNMTASATQQSRQLNKNTLYQTEPDLNKIKPFIKSGNKGGV